MRSSQWTTSAHHRALYQGALQGTLTNASVTHLLCHFDYLRDSRNPVEKATGEALRRMSGGKCFDCERKLLEVEQEVDHHVEVAEKPELAFAWANLDLACGPCNGRKAPNTDIPNATCVDPCLPGATPEAHLAFDDERTDARNGSPRGVCTIQKYRLDHDELDLARPRALGKFNDAPPEARTVGIVVLWVGRPSVAPLCIGQRGRTTPDVPARRECIQGGAASRRPTRGTAVRPLRTQRPCSIRWHRATRSTARASSSWVTRTASR